MNCFAFLLLPPVPLNMLLFFMQKNQTWCWSRDGAGETIFVDFSSYKQFAPYNNGGKICKWGTLWCSAMPGIHVQELIKWLLKRGGSMYVSMLGSCATSAVCQTKMKASILAQPAPVSRMHNQPVGGANTRQQWEKHLEETTSGNATRLNYEQQCAAFQRILFDVPIVHHYFFYALGSDF